MEIYKRQELEDYKRYSLKIQDSWNQRDFTSVVKDYLNSRAEKVLAISGLRGTGKKVGILQAANGLDICFIIAQKGEKETGKDYINAIEKVEEKYIIINEYGWINDRDALDRYLLTSVQNGKRIVITGTESITLDFLNYGALNHRVHVVHTTMFTYEEYRRIYGKEHSKAVYKEYLMEGVLFKDYALKNFDSMKKYIEEAIVNNLAGYLKKEMSVEKARILAYSVLYMAVCPSNLSNVPTIRNKQTTLEQFLALMDVNRDIEVNEQEINRVTDIFEHVGLLTRVKDYDEERPVKVQYYLSIPSLTCQLIFATYNIREIDKHVLTHLYKKDETFRCK